MNTTSPANPVELLSVGFDLNKLALNADVSVWLLVGLVVITLIVFAFMKVRFQRYQVTELEISFGNIGKVKIKPNADDIQVAHKIWTQLVTRKAAIQIEPSKDVIVEIYDSWYALFGEIRKLISDIPAQQIKKSAGTKELIRIATSTLNNGLRPHLTTWQAKYRNWYKQNEDKLKGSSPQEVQAQFPEYASLVQDMQTINQQMIAYAAELKKLIDA